MQNNKNNSDDKNRVAINKRMNICKSSIDKVRSEEDSINKQKAIKLFYAFLAKYALDTDSTNILTHTCFGQPYGRYSIPDDKLSEFYELYANALVIGETHVIERPKEVGPLILDIDYYTEDKKRHYTENHTRGLIEIINKFVIKTFKVNEHMTKAFVFEKRNPSIKQTADKADKYKDGFHIMYPYLALPKHMRFLIIDEAKAEVIKTNLFKDIPLKNPTLDDVFDISIVINNGLTMYGSCKDGCQTYILTKVYKHNKNNILEEDDITKYSIKDLIGILSNRQYSEKDQINLHDNLNMFNLEEKINDIKAKYDKSIKKPKQKSGTNNNAGPKKDKDWEFVRELVGMLSIERATDYNEWIRVGWALHNINDDYLDLFKEFSKKCKDKYDENSCNKVWDEARDNGYAMSSLNWWVRKDDPTKYTALMRRSVMELFREAENGTEYDIAKIIFELYKDCYKCASIKYSVWYEFRGHRWVEIQGAYSLHIKLSEELSTEFVKLISEMWGEAVITDGLNRDDFMKRANKLQTLLLNLKRNAFKNRIIAECTNLLYDATFESKLDSNTHLLGFDNGIFDLRDMTFRDGTPDDYVSKTTGYDFKEFSLDHPYVKDILELFRKMHHDDTMRHYILKLLASYLDGSTKLQQFIIWTGTGANGKGRTILLVQLALGDYFGVLPVTVLTRKQGDSGRASPEMASTRGKRFVVFQEPENTDEINVGRMKELTGGDKITCRPLYHDHIVFKPQFKLLLACNKLPHIPSRDGGTWRRLRVSPWEAEFVPVDNYGHYKNKPLKPNQFPRDYDLDDKLEVWKEAFMWLLLTVYYPAYKKKT